MKCLVLINIGYGIREVLQITAIRGTIRVFYNTALVHTLHRLHVSTLLLIESELMGRSVIDSRLPRLVIKVR